MSRSALFVMRSWGQDQVGKWLESGIKNLLVGETSYPGPLRAGPTPPSYVA